MAECDSRYHAVTKYSSACLSGYFPWHFKEHFRLLASNDLRLTFQQDARFADVEKHAQFELSTSSWTIEDRFANSEAASSRAVQSLFSNWQLSGIVIAMSGLPVDVFDPAAGDLYGLFFGARPNWAPGAFRKTATTNIPAGYFFNPYAFALPVVHPKQPIPSAQAPTALAPEGGNDISNLGRNVLRGPSQSNIDLSVAKALPVSESKRVEVRADFFNLLKI